MNAIGRHAFALWSLLAASAAGASETLSVQPANGTVFYEYGFDLPAARGRYQPSLSLRYGRLRGGGTVNAATFHIPPIPSIVYAHVDDDVTREKAWWYADERTPRRLLVPSPRDGAGHWNAAVEEQTLDFWSYDANTWCGRDGVGNLYRFENRAGVAGSMSTTYSLTQVVDPDGNVTSYAYYSPTVNWPTCPAIVGWLPWWGPRLPPR